MPARRSPRTLPLGYAPEAPVGVKTYGTYNGARCAANKLAASRNLPNGVLSVVQVAGGRWAYEPRHRAMGMGTPEKTAACRELYASLIYITR